MKNCGTNRREQFFIMPESIEWSSRTPYISMLVFCGAILKSYVQDGCMDQVILKNLRNNEYFFRNNKQQSAGIDRQFGISSKKRRAPI